MKQKKTIIDIFHLLVDNMPSVRTDGFDITGYKDSKGNVTDYFGVRPLTKELYHQAMTGALEIIRGEYVPGDNDLKQAVDELISGVQKNIVKLDTFEESPSWLFLSDTDTIRIESVIAKEVVKTLDIPTKHRTRVTALKAELRAKTPLYCFVHNLKLTKGKFNSVTVRDGDKVKEVLVE